MLASFCLLISTLPYLLKKNSRMPPTTILDITATSLHASLGHMAYLETVLAQPGIVNDPNTIIIRLLKFLIRSLYDFLNCSQFHSWCMPNSTHFRWGIHPEPAGQFSIHFDTFVLRSGRNRCSKPSLGGKASHLCSRVRRFGSQIAFFSVIS